MTDTANELAQAKANAARAETPLPDVAGLVERIDQYTRVYGVLTDSDRQFFAQVRDTITAQARQIAERDADIARLNEAHTALLETATPSRRVAKLKEENAQLLDLLCLADNTIMGLNGCFPLDPGVIRDACLKIRAKTGEDFDARNTRARRALEGNSIERGQDGSKGDE